MKTEKYQKKTELWGGIKNEIETINVGKTGENGKDFMKISFDTDDNFPLNKPLMLPMLTIIVRYLKKTVKFISKFILMSVYMSFKNGNIHRIVQITYLMTIWLLVLKILTPVY